MADLSLVIIRNPFNRRDRDVKALPLAPGMSLALLRAQYFPAGMDVAVSVNGALVPVTQQELVTLREGDQIALIPVLHGGGDDGGGKNILRTIALIALVVAAPGIGAYLAWGTGVGSVALWTMGAMIVGGLLINALLPPPKPKLPTTDTTDVDTSPSYGWNSATTQQQGLAINRWYGTHKLRGNIITSYIENDGAKQYLNALIDLGIGQYKRLYDFKVNGQPIENYQGVTVETRLGYLDQTVISAFNDTPTQYPQSVKVVYGTPYTYTTPGSDFDALQIEVSFPNGLYYADDNGGLSNYAVSFRVEYRKQGAGSWISLTNSTVTSTETVYTARWSAGVWMGAPDGTSSWNETAAGSTDPYAHYDGEPYTTADDPTSWRWIPDATTVRTVVSDVDYATVTGSQQQPLRRQFRADDLEAGTYEVRITNLTADQTGSRYADDLYLTAVNEIAYDDFQYPRTVLAAVRALATDQISGGLQFDCLGECALIRTYNGSAWSIGLSDNPAWVCYDILTQPVFYDPWRASTAVASGKYVRPLTLNGKRYECTTAGTTGATEPTWPTVVGNTVADGTAVWTCRAGATVDGVIRFDGVDPSRLDTAAFTAWADWCDELVTDGAGGTEKRCLFNGGFDRETTLWEAALQVAQSARAVPVWNGVNLTVVYDHAQATPAQLFSVGNLGADKFRETFLPMADRASEIEVDFTNVDRDYERDKLTVVNTGIDSTVNKVNLQLFGVTRATQSWREGMYRLYRNQYLVRTCELDVDIDSIACTVGDRVDVQHDVPQWGYGGRLVSATATSVTFDKTVTIESGKTYEVRVRLSNDTIVTRTVTDGPGSYTTVNVSSAFSSTPQQYDVYAFGESNVSTKPFIVIGIQRKGDQQATLTCIEYNASVYNADTDTPAVPGEDYSALDPLPSVSGIVLGERLVALNATTVGTVIDVRWTRPAENFVVGFDVWYHDGSVWRFAGTTTEDFYTIPNITTVGTYKVAVLTINQVGERTKLQNAPYATLNVSGLAAAPSDVTGFSVIKVGGVAQPQWNLHDDLDVKIGGYIVIRHSPLTSGATWNDGIILDEFDGNTVSGLVPLITGTYMAKALDSSGNYSANAVSFVATEGMVTGFTTVATSTQASGFSGNKTNVALVGGTAIQLDGTTLIDSMATNIDDWPYIDSLGGISATGSYAFDTYLDMGSVATRRFEADITAESFDTGDLIDNRTDPIDTWGLFDGDAINDCDVTLYAATTDDDPAGTPTWGSWTPFMVADFTCRAAKFKLDFSSGNPTHNIKVSQMTVHVKEAA